MKSNTILIILFGLTLHVNSQNNISSRASQLQLEILGPGSIFSINFDSRFLKKEKGLGYRIGLGGAPLGVLGNSCNSGSMVTLPLGLTYITGKHESFIRIWCRRSNWYYKCNKGVLS